MSHFQPVTELELPCKCCGAAARIFGVVDFNKCCMPDLQPPLEMSGIPVYYHRCGECGFVFTGAFDGFTQEQFRQHIYNDGYARIDPDYDKLRPEGNAAFIGKLLRDERSLRVLDYGSGSGLLAEKLREAGFVDVSCYDPFVEQSASKPEGKFDFITCFEVLEHTTTPRQTIAEILSMIREPGMVLFSTLFVPDDIEKQGLNWWYAAPRNGHVSLYSEQSLKTLAGSFGYRVGSFSESMHVMVNEIPPFAERFSPKD
jgi:2-polyprenyl-6-hydroxyphenyl methylase/3-demethylubiquinone-9 3-methyltransferase